MGMLHRAAQYNSSTPMSSALVRDGGRDDGYTARGGVRPGSGAARQARGGQAPAPGNGRLRSGVVSGPV